MNPALFVATPPDELGHDLKNLLAKIMGAAELALGHAVSPEVREELKLIIGLVEDSVALIDSVQLHGATVPAWIG